MRILVTGANGFIGKYVCALLAKNAHYVIGVVRSEEQEPRMFFLDHDLVIPDLSESGSLEGAAAMQPEMVVHLAAMVPKSFEEPEALSAAEKNMQIDQTVFSFCQRNKVGLIYASSTSVYGLGDGRVMKESDKTNPIGPYAAQKARSEEMGTALLPPQGLQYTALRICAPYGPGQKTATVLNIFVDRASGGLPLLYHGTGSRQQDFTYVEDIAAAVLFAAERKKSGIYNIAGGRPVSMRQLAEMVVHCIPNCSSIVRSSGQRDPQESSTALFSIEHARKELGWTPQVSLEEGLNLCIQAKLSVIE